ncbi:hypothetical protein TPA0598_04_03280 [Streptomyces lydicamycinicus]|uniref:Uncharacterized protein n=1 Tax=Streptomyces lydicamycinicus TaxID=1546107 RepID=A0A0P4R6F6_9ACTN|nr:hypothetical protein [Streptomyces lydicamycinicus]GAO08692.1 hypothetical protein TPA0598_04_03280 [Streptomyces lydicamycinicus]
MEITDTSAACLQQVRVTTDGTKASIQIGGVDYSRVVSGYTIHQLAGQPADLVIQLARGKSGSDFDGFARVAVGVPHEPGPAAAAFLSAMDAGLLEKAALARPDLEGGQYGFTKAVLAQLQQWARGEFDPNPETN